MPSRRDQQSRTDPSRAMMSLAGKVIRLGIEVLDTRRSKLLLRPCPPRLNARQKFTLQICFSIVSLYLITRFGRDLKKSRSEISNEAHTEDRHVEKETHIAHATNESPGSASARTPCVPPALAIPMPMRWRVRDLSSANGRVQSGVSCPQANKRSKKGAGSGT